MDKTIIDELMTTVVESMNHQDTTANEVDYYYYRLARAGDSIDGSVVVYLYYPSEYYALPREVRASELGDLERVKSRCTQQELDNYIMYNFGI